MYDITRKFRPEENLENKSKILRILLSNCELKGINTSIYWNKPFDILLELGQTENRGGLTHELKTFLRQVSVDFQAQ